MKNTHHTGDCKKYNLDGTPKTAFPGRSTQQNAHNGIILNEHNTGYAQLSAKITKIEKSNRKLKHTKK